MTNALALYLVALAAVLSADGAPLTGDTANLDPAQFITHNYVTNMLECLKLRDEGQEMSPQCVPGVFSSIEDVPSPRVVNTILNHVANTTMEEINMTMDLTISEEKVLAGLSSVHLRVHKNKTDIETAQQISRHCNTSSGIDISISILSDSNEIDPLLLHTFRLPLEDLLKEQWMDFTSFKQVYNSTIHSSQGTSLHVELDIKDCEFLTLHNIGMDVKEGFEPVLVVFAKEDDENVLLKGVGHAAAQAMAASQRKKRQVEGSGNLVDPHKCRLVEHNIAYSHLQVTFPGQFSINYCSGHCILPLPTTISSLHALVALYSRQLPDHQQIPAPCCVPTKYTALSFPAKESKWIYILKTLENITAKECGCR